MDDLINLQETTVIGTRDGAYYNIKACEQELVNKIVQKAYEDGKKDGYVQAKVEQESKTGQYEKHIDHTDCIWYVSGSDCPVTCSQYRDGWNDAMDYIFKNGKGYQPYRHDG